MPANYQYNMWVTAQGYTMYPKEMQLGHLSNTIKMVWNNIAPVCFKQSRTYTHLNRKKYSNVYLFNILELMVQEFMSRKENSYSPYCTIKMIKERYELMTGRKI